jgi:hypothetical protein
MALQFGVWLLNDASGSAPIAGVGADVSGGGLQFLFEKHFTERHAAIAFETGGRQMRADILVIEAAQTMFRGQPWYHYRAKFVGMLRGDFNFLVEFIDARAEAVAPSRLPAVAPVKRGGATISATPLESYDKLPDQTKKQILQTLVRIKRLAPGEPARGTLIATHYGGAQSTDTGLFHRFWVRTRVESPAGSFVYNTDLLISDDGTEIVVHE